MCDCVKNLEQRYIEQQPLKDNVVLNAKLQGRVFLFNSGISATSSILEVEVKGRKSAIKQNVIHTYCPFCGEKYESVKEVGNG